MEAEATKKWKTSTSKGRARPRSLPPQPRATLRQTLDGQLHRRAVKAAGDPAHPRTAARRRRGEAASGWRRRGQAKGPSRDREASHRTPIPPPEPLQADACTAHLGDGSSFGLSTWELLYQLQVRTMMKPANMSSGRLEACASTLSIYPEFLKINIAILRDLAAEWVRY